MRTCFRCAGNLVFVDTMTGLRKVDGDGSELSQCDTVGVKDTEGTLVGDDEMADADEPEEVGLHEGDEEVGDIREGDGVWELFGLGGGVFGRLVAVGYEEAWIVDDIVQILR